VKYSIVI